jgi:hypothetical protein
LSILEKTMSSIQQLSGVVAAAWRPGTFARTGEASRGDTEASRASVDSDAPSFSDAALQASRDRARFSEWVANVNNAERPSSLLVQRPLPDGIRPTYPSAIEAYREVTELIPKL